MALESEPQSTLIGGSNLDALKSESSNNVDLEDGEIDDDDEEEMPTATKASGAASTSVPPSKPSFTPTVHQTSKSHDSNRRESPPWSHHRPVHNSPIANKNRRGLKRNWEPSHKKPYHNDDEDEEDFAVHLEKALREKAQKHQAMKEGVHEEGEAEGSDNEDHGKKRKKRKTRWDDDEERDPKHQRKSRDDEDDMIFVRGASPHRHENRDSPSFGNDFKNSFDSYAEEDEDYEDMNERNNHGGFLGRGRGRGGKIVRGRGRGRLGISSEGLRGNYNKRGIKRGNLRGGSLSKSPHMIRDRMQDNICSYYMQGKCAKGPEDCPYSHDAQPPRKMELCKFYLKNCCAKREKCLYMHKDFPCKFFHTGRKCDSGENCRFSHDKMSDITRNVLLKHLELAPKEILGEFKRFTREQANQIIDKAAKLRAQGKNPEGINLLMYDDEAGYASGEERAHTPMPSSPGEPVPQEESKMNRDDGHHSSRKRDSRDRYRDHDRGRDRGRETQHEYFERKDQGDKRDHRERRRKRRWDSPDSSPSRLEKLQQKLKEELLLHEISEKASPNPSGDSINVDAHKVDENKDSKGRQVREDKNDMSKNDDEELSNKMADKKTLQLENNLENKGGDPEKHLTHENSGDSGGESQDSFGAIPSHLPKRQRELFMRIQQQMREADQSNDKKRSESSDDPPPEDDFYSSDEDGPASLTDLIKSLPKGQRTEEKTNKASTDPLPNKSEKGSEGQASHQKPDMASENPPQQSRRPALLPTPINLNDLMKSSAIDQLLSSIRYGSQVTPNPASSSPVQSSSQTATQLENSSSPVGPQTPGQAPPAQAPAPMRDPRLARDPRNRGTGGPGGSGGPAGAVASPMGSPSSQHSQAQAPEAQGRADPRLERERDRDRDRDPRLDRRDPRTDPRTEHREAQASLSPRADRPIDPRATRRTSDTSSCSSTGRSSNPPKSIYDGTGLPLTPGSGDIDLRVRDVGHDHIGSTDFHIPGSQLGSGDMDMRHSDYSVMAGAHSLPAHDTDLRIGLNNTLMDMDADYTAASHNDLDLRRLEMMLPFKPAPVHSAATEINASLLSYTPGPYRVKLIDIPRPDFSALKINSLDPQAKLDPRLRRLFRLSQDELPSGILLSPSSSDTVPVMTPPAMAPSDPRRRNSITSRPADPRQGRAASGGMVGFCPPTPRLDDFEDPNVTDSDQHGFYGQPWDSVSRGRGLLPTPDHSDQSTWALTGRSRTLLSRPSSYQQQRSYTPPPL